MSAVPVCPGLLLLKPLLMIHVWAVPHPPSECSGNVFWPLFWTVDAWVPILIPVSYSQQQKPFIECSLEVPGTVLSPLLTLS